MIILKNSGITFRLNARERGVRIVFENGVRSWAQHILFAQRIEVVLQCSGPVPV